MTIRPLLSSRTAAALGLIIGSCLCAYGFAADLPTTVSTATTQLTAAKTSIATLIGAVLGVVGLVYTGIMVGKYMKDHQMEHLVKIGCGLIALAVGTAVILTF